MSHIETQGKRNATRARKVLKGKNWTKAWKLAKLLDISSQEAGQVLTYLSEWQLWNPEQKNRFRRPWKRVSE